MTPGIIPGVYEMPMAHCSLMILLSANMYMHEDVSLYPIHTPSNTHSSGAAAL